MSVCVLCLCVWYLVLLSLWHQDQAEGVCLCQYCLVFVCLQIKSVFFLKSGKKWNWALTLPLNYSPHTPPTAKATADY